MKIGIIADTHDKIEITRAAIQDLKAHGVVALFHCGDLLGLGVLELCRDLPSYVVFGNNDKPQSRLLQAAADWGIHHLGDGGEVVLNNWRIAMTHGHLPQQVKRLLQAQPDVLLLGHSHQRRDEHRNGTWIINPGALHRATVKTCALLDLEERRLEFLSQG